MRAETAAAIASRAPIVHAHQLGDRIEARCVESGRWRAGFVMQHAPYRGRPGYYVAWDLPRGTPSWISRGVWQPENCTRPYIQPAVQ